MKETSLESTLERMEVPAPTKKARADARDVALAEFARVQAANQDVAASVRDADQGFWSALRLSRADQSHGRTSMNWFGGRTLFGGIASGCVVALGIVMVWPIFTRNEVVGMSGPEPQAIELLREPLVLQPDDTAPPADAVTPSTGPRPAEKAVESDKQKKDGRVRIELAARGDAAAAVPVSATPGKEGEQVIVTGSRQSLPNSVELKRNVYGVTDSIASPAIETYSPATPAIAGAASSGNVSRVSAFNGRLAMPVQPEPGGVATPDEGRDKFQQFDVNPVKAVADEPVSTFSVDVDTASYSFARRMLNGGVLPQKDAVRVEEMINYFDYAWPVPDSRKEPFEPTIIVSDSPWGAGKKLLHIGIKGYELPREKAPDVNLVLLLDVSGSMSSADKLPLAIQSMELLLSSLRPSDTVGIVVYAGQAGLVLEPTPVKDKPKILDALRSLRPGGSTAGAEGIELAYQLAESHFRKGGVNRILLATDGDFNVGIDGTEPLKGFVERKREKGIFLSVLGFGQGNYRDELAQALAQNGNGVAAYIDTLSEAQKVLVQESTASLFTIAKDVKLQVEFNPLTVAEYRLVGYETRALKREDFNNDAIDAGDVGSGHTVTAIYEITPTGSPAKLIEPRRYGGPASNEPRDSRDEYGFLKIRYKLPDEQKSRLIERAIPLSTGSLPAHLQRDLRFSTAVAGFAQLLRGGSYTGALKYEDVLREAQASKGEDPFGYRTEFVQLVRKAEVARGM